jgi:hypothetical protein
MVLWGIRALSILDPWQADIDILFTHWRSSACLSQLADLAAAS